MRIWLLQQSGSPGPSPVEVTSLEFKMGRASDCVLRIADDRVSRQHCKIVVERDHVTIHDLQSRNGTFVNGEAVQEGGRELHSEDLIAVGPVLYKVIFEQAGQTSAVMGTTQVVPSPQ
jgi:pSer/pThr/pTyr-binding forkhead associated (FHA) protein